MTKESRKRVIQALRFGLDANSLVGDGSFREPEWDEQAKLIQSVIDELGGDDGGS